MNKVANNEKLSLDLHCAGAIIFDATCGSREGHFYDSIVDFARLIKEHIGYDCSIWVADTNEKWPQSEFLLLPRIPWMFEFFWKTSATSKIALIHRAFESIFGPRHRSPVARIVDSLLLAVGSIIGEYQIKKALRQVLITSPDIILFPNIDYYSLRAIAGLAEKGLVPATTKLIVRMIAICEYPIMRDDFLPLTIVALQKLIRHHQNVILTTETDKYSALIERQLYLSKKVYTTSLPRTQKVVCHSSYIMNIHQQIRNMNNSNPIILLCAGAARRDKGYFELVRIAQFLNMTSNGVFIIVAQAMDDTHLQFNRDYDRQIRSQSNILLLKSNLSNVDYVNMIAIADVMLLPYHENVYHHRGSAVLVDALCHNKLVISTKHTSLGHTIESNNVGSTYETLSELSDILQHILKYSENERLEIKKRQELFLNNNIERLKNIIK